MTDTHTQQGTIQQQRIAPRYKVLLHNDEFHSMEFVVHTLVKCVPDITVDVATMVMLEAHNTGRGIITVCPFVEAAIYRDRLRSYTLGASVERA
jgi:ATP-dependent Clp protease adaptor protein ClpS